MDIKRKIIQTLMGNPVLNCHFVEELLQEDHGTLEYTLNNKDQLLFASIIKKVNLGAPHKYLYIKEDADVSALQHLIKSETAYMFSAETGLIENALGIKDNNYLLRMTYTPHTPHTKEETKENKETEKVTTGNLKPAQIDETETVTRFYKDFYQVKEANRDSIHKKIQDEAYLLYYHNNMPVGMIYEYINNKYCTYITTVYIQPEFRKRGLGRLMLKEYLHSKEKPVILDVEPENPAVQLYKSMNFEESNRQSYITV